MTLPTSTTDPIYTKALKRALDEKLEITLLESWGAHVTSSQDDTGFYTVRFTAHSSTCNCEAGRRGIYCKHRALVHYERTNRIQARQAGRALNAPAVAERDSWSNVRVSDRNWRDQYAAKVQATKTLVPYICEDCEEIFYGTDGDHRICPDCGRERDYKHGINN